MDSIAVITMVISMLVIFGGLIASATTLLKSPEK
ncbi:methionine/alanine import family NSS transporter small subunit [Salininema proteolyticum]|uniref:Methionine/alanine import family NSS transporter small subunit n=1 Tax=Salininema proteolyticum TaxID=1607685 RepID=A0ABV8U0Z4_9ACTN